MNESDDNQHPARQASPLRSGIPTSNNGLRLATIDVAAEGGLGEVGNQALEEDEKQGPVTWMSLPHKRQLIILTLARLSEPLVQTSLQVRPRCLSHFRLPPLFSILG
jgi:hypothetical protein